MPSIVRLLATVAMATGLAAAAQGQVSLKLPPPMFKPQTEKPAAPIAQVAQPLTWQQNRALYPEGPVRPGVYRIRVQHSGLCLTLNFADNLGGASFTAQQPCLADGALGAESQRFTVLPRSGEFYTLRTNALVRDNRAPVPGQVSNCLTVARGVVVGPSRIDVRGCDLPNGNGDWAAAGVPDQQFSFVSAGGSAYEIRPSEVGLTVTLRSVRNCMAVRGGVLKEGTDFIMWPCNGNADQHFLLEPLSPVLGETEAALLSGQGWGFSPSGQVRLVSAPGVMLSGADFNSFETIMDGGDYCKRSCAADSTCTAWTWTGTGFAGAAKPVCHWKRAPGTASNQGEAVFGLIASGIVRP